MAGLFHQRAPTVPPRRALLQKRYLHSNLPTEPCQRGPFCNDSSHAMPQAPPTHPNYVPGTIIRFSIQTLGRTDLMKYSINGISDKIHCSREQWDAHIFKLHTYCHAL